MDELFSVFQGQAYSSSDDDEEMSLEVEEGQDEEVHSRGNRNGAEIQSKISTTKSIRERRNKRHVDGARKNGLFQPNGHSEGDVDMDRAIPTSSDDEPDRSLANLPDDRKRRKKDFGPAPVLTDAFQTAQSREVAVDGGFEAPEQAETEAGALVLSHNIQHQVALPPDLDYEYVPLSKHKPPDKPARTWDFKLDPFQTLSVASIERDESVLVSAHTSAGKTVVAEYAIAQCLQRNQRVVYTSPIKALSNQKYRDFEAIFGDVGLMTGDVTINPSASCLVMTTEILRSMLYRGSEVMREVAWVVFDEIHYMRDKIRGVVWEEAIILLPDKVRYVFLSATIPNAFQFAEWIAKIHHQACHVVYTDFRPTPLQNYFYPAGSKGLYLVVDEKGVFKEHSFNAAMRAVEEGAKVKSDANRRGGKTKSRKQTKADDDKNSPILNVIRNIMKRKYHPVIVFNFSKRECEAMAMTISQMRLTTEVERGMVRTVFGNALESLPEADRGLPHLTNLLPLLEKGIGVHHGGLLPILKETIEILFQESLVKVLFATETFSIGLNMPAKTVVFSQVKKWDGIQTRPLTSSEYIQMSGRAGRRGLDTRGIVIMMVDDKIESDTFKQIVVGHQDRLNSAFYLGHNMVLNLLRIEAVSPEFMLERCFHQFQNAANVPALEKELAGLQQARDGMVIPDESTVKDYHSIRQQLTSNVREMRRVIQLPENCRDFLQDGRMVQVNNPEDGADDVTDGRDFGWGVVVGKTPRRGGPDEFRPQESIVVDVFLPIAADSAHFAPGRVEGNMPKGLKPRGAKDEGQCAVVPCLLTCITCIGQVRVLTPKADRWTDVERLQLEKSLEEVKRRFPDGLPPLDPLLNMGISDSGFKKTLRKIEVLEARLSANPLHGSTLLPQRWEQYREKHKLEENIKEQKKAIARAHTITQMDELKARKRVLRRLGFINEHEVVQLKGRVACEIAATEGHELLLTELLFDRFFNELTPEQCAAMLSVFILDETLESQPLKEDLAKSYRGIVAKARIIVKISQESKIELNEDDYVKGLKWQLIEVVHAWASGASFKTICEMTNAFEGSLIRLFRRLEEVLRQMSEGAKVMGSTDLAEKFNEGMTRIRRDIVAAQSLYL